MLKDSERLTERDKNGTAWPFWKDKSIPCCQKHLLDDLWCVEGKCVNTQCDFRHIVDRLAEYEDTKLTPSEIQDLKEKSKKERNK